MPIFLERLLLFVRTGWVEGIKLIFGTRSLYLIFQLGGGGGGWMF